jgi:hypothetical protein
MKKLRTGAVNSVVLFGVVLFVLPVFGKDARLSPEEIVAKHLESLGSAQAREAVKSRAAEGTVQFNEVFSGKIHMEGTAQLISQGRKVKMALRFGQPQYPGEQFVFDGQSIQVAMTDPGARSLLGNFMFTQSEILSEGLPGGTLSTGWPLLNLKERQAKLKYEGLKKIGDRELYELTYVPKKRGGNGELLIRLYFDPDTFRHVLSVYRLTLRNTSGSIREGTDELKETVEERFDDFGVVDGLTLPRHWEMRYRKEPSSKPQELQWDIRFSNVTHNVLGQ